MGKEFRVLMVCMGNICRSPTAEAVLRHKLRERGLDGRVEVDSAGTHEWHVGRPPDERAQEHAALRGYDLAPLRARCVDVADFERFDLLLGMDEDNVDHLRAICPPPFRDRISRLTAYARRHRNRPVPDPYAGGPAGFEAVLDMVEDACEGLVATLADRLAREGNFAA